MGATWTRGRGPALRIWRRIYTSWPRRSRLRHLGSGILSFSRPCARSHLGYKTDLIGDGRLPRQSPSWNGWAGYARPWGFLSSVSFSLLSLLSFCCVLFLVVVVFFFFFV